MPALEALLDRFRAAHTQVLGVSIDSIYCHANWARDLGGVSFPLLSDFEPKGAMARAYGLYLEDAGITDRATVLIDASGVVHHVSSVGPGGQRDIGDLASLAEHLDADYTGEREAFADGPFQAASQQMLELVAVGGGIDRHRQRTPGEAHQGGVIADVIGDALVPDHRDPADLADALGKAVLHQVA